MGALKNVKEAKDMEEKDKKNKKAKDTVVVRPKDLHKPAIVKTKPTLKKKIVAPASKVIGGAKAKKGASSDLIFRTLYPTELDENNSINMAAVSRAAPSETKAGFKSSLGSLSLASSSSSLQNMESLNSMTQTEIEEELWKNSEMLKDLKNKQEQQQQKLQTQL
mmetsp:Transcript_36877/g.56443  ORF Transcript_36877/g.56443 Transcript_36877/m.56443 type:complete len:164 (+) Transcript_36877:2497-2988(+)